MHRYQNYAGLMDFGIKGFALCCIFRVGVINADAMCDLLFVFVVSTFGQLSVNICGYTMQRQGQIFI